VQNGKLLPIFRDNFHITKLFKKQNMGVAYKTKINIGRILNRNKETNDLNSTTVAYTNFDVPTAPSYVLDKWTDNTKPGIKNTFCLQI
jgi:hypothetical protein